MNLQDDADIHSLGMAAFMVDYKEEGDADYRGWNSCLNKIWEYYARIREEKDAQDR